jgi:prophage antirepressor-like protein
MTVKVLTPVRKLNLVAPLPHKGTAMHITDTAAPAQVWSGAVTPLIGAIEYIATHARSMRARARFIQNLTPANTIGYTSGKSSSSCGAGCESPIDRCDESRSTARFAAFSFRAPVLAARMGRRKPRRFAPAVTGLSHPFELPPDVRVGRQLFLKDQLEINMTDLFTSAPAQVTPFSFNNSAVRVIIRDGEPWFVAADVAKALGYSSPKDAAEHLDDDEKGSAITRTPGGDQSVTVISESGLYALVLRSRKPEARKFAKWVTSEVLPSIRKTGGYQQPVNMAHALEAANAVAAQVQAVVFEQLLSGGKRWQNERWMLSFQCHGRTNEVTPHANQIEGEAVVMSLARLATAIAEPNGMMPSNTELANLAAACNQRLAQRMEYQASQKAVTA